MICGTGLSQGAAGQYLSANVSSAAFHRGVEFPLSNRLAFVALTYYGNPDPEFGGMGSETLNEKRYRVADLAPAAKRKFVYEYDFGDGWQHEVLTEN